MKVIYVRLESGLVIAHTEAEYAALWADVDVEAAHKMTAPLEEDE